jgi:hypothetical protein
MSPPMLLATAGLFTRKADSAARTRPVSASSLRLGQEVEIGERVLKGRRMGELAQSHLGRQRFALLDREGEASAAVT